MVRKTTTETISAFTFNTPPLHPAQSARTCIATRSIAATVRGLIQYRASNSLLTSTLVTF